jgi:uncharacterized membrane protein
MAAPQAKRRASALRSSRTQMIVYMLVSLFALGGLADALYLTVMHVTGQAVLCGDSISCSQVLASKYSHVGPIPTAAFGLIGYFTVFTCATFSAFGWVRARFWLALVVGLMLIGTLWLLFVQAFLLHQYCRYCLFSAAITFLLAGIIVAMPAAPAEKRGEGAI